MIKNQEGFTLVETLIALMLLALVLTAVAVPLLSFNKVNVTSQNTLSATTAAQQQLEAVRTLITSNYSYIPPLTSAQLGGVTCVNLNALDSVMTPPACEALSNPPMRRLTITKTVTGVGTPVTLTLDVRP